MKLSTFIGNHPVSIEDLEIIYHHPLDFDDNGTAGVEVRAQINGKNYKCLMNSRQEIIEDITHVIEESFKYEELLGLREPNQLAAHFMAHKIVSRYPDIAHGKMATPAKREFTGEETVKLITIALATIITNAIEDTLEVDSPKEENVK